MRGAEIAVTLAPKGASELASAATAASPNRPESHRRVPLTETRATDPDSSAMKTSEPQSPPPPLAAAALIGPSRAASAINEMGLTWRTTPRTSTCCAGGVGTSRGRASTSHWWMPPDRLCSASCARRASCSRAGAAASRWAKSVRVRGTNPAASTRRAGRKADARGAEPWRIASRANARAASPMSAGPASICHDVRRVDASRANDTLMQNWSAAPAASAAARSAGNDGESVTLAA